MATLYELTAEIQEIESLLASVEDGLEQHTFGEEAATLLIADYLDDKEEALAKKIDGYVAYYRSLQACAQAQRAEGKHLYDMAKANENSMDRLKEAVKYASHQLGRSKLQGNTRSITVSETNKLAVDVVDQNAIPEQYLESRLEWIVKKDAIAEHVMATGEIVNGVEVRKITTVRFN